MFRFGTGFGLLNCPLSEFNGDYHGKDMKDDKCEHEEEKYTNLKKMSKKDLIKQKYLEKSSEL